MKSDYLCENHFRKQKSGGMYDKLRKKSRILANLRYFATAFFPLTALKKDVCACILRSIDGNMEASNMASVCHAGKCSCSYDKRFGEI